MRYVVIFKAYIRQLDADYFVLAQQLRERALSQFGCCHFAAITEGTDEVALSYWNSLEDIQTWHQDAQHQWAQRLGKNQWYENFTVEVCEVLRRYGS